jgi:hypothetical protein
MLFLGDQKTARESLPATYSRPENAGNRWRGIAHRDLAEAVALESERNGFEITSEDYNVYGPKNGDPQSRMIGTLGLRSDSLPGIDGQEYMIGYINNLDMSRALVMVSGTRVFICSNGMVVGELILTRKHTTGVNLFDEVRNAFGEAVNRFSDAAQVVDRLKVRRLTSLQVDRSFMDIGRAGILPWSAIGKAVDEYREPSHDEFREFDGRAFGLYQATNHVIKQRNATDQMTGLRDLTKVLLPGQWAAA